MTLEQLSADAKTLAAINYELLILGEAASRMPEEVVLAHPAVPWAQLRGTRNVLVHGYFQLSLTMRIPAKPITHSGRSRSPEA